MRLPSCAAVSMLFAGIVFQIASGQSRSADSAPSGGSRIAGRVTVDGKSAVGVGVLLFTPDNANSPLSLTFTRSRSLGEVKARAVCDGDGNYTFNNLAPANYIVFPFGPTLSAPFSSGLISPGKSVSIGDAESIEGLDFDIARGGVITGRLTRPDGQPAIEVPISIQSLDQPDSPNLDMATGREMSSPLTDDRGIYRVFGLSPGRYLVFARQPSGADKSSTAVYYPGVTDKTSATVITVAGGQENDNIDITLRKAGGNYEAAGQAVDADTGKPVVGVMYYHYVVSDSGDVTESSDADSSIVTDQNGEFRITGLASGRYGVSLKFEAGQSEYCDPAVFTVPDSDVSGLQVKVHTGATVSGVVTVEGAQDPQILSKLSGVSLRLFLTLSSGRLGADPSVKPGGDSSFQASGFPPGQLSFSIDEFHSTPGFSLLRIERNGIPQPREIPVAPADQITGLRVVLAYGTGIVRGQVIFQGGQLPPGTLVYVVARLASADQPTMIQRAPTDARGMFQISNLPDGQYRLTVLWSGGSIEGNQQGPVVTVSGGEAPVTNIVVNLNKGS